MVADASLGERPAELSRERTAEAVGGGSDVPVGQLPADKGHCLPARVGRNQPFQTPVQIPNSGRQFGSECCPYLLLSICRSDWTVPGAQPRQLQLALEDSLRHAKVLPTTMGKGDSRVRISSDLRGRDQHRGRQPRGRDADSPVAAETRRHGFLHPSQRRPRLGHFHRHFETREQAAEANRMVRELAQSEFKHLMPRLPIARVGEIVGHFGK
jgi:hypothetical protein